MQGCVDLLPCPFERREAIFRRVSGGDSDAWRPHTKAPAGPGPTPDAGGCPDRPAQHHGHESGNRVTPALDSVFLGHQTVPGLRADSGHADAGRRARGPSVPSRLVAEGGRSDLGVDPSTLGKWERGERVPAGRGRSGRSRMVGGAVNPTLSRRFAQLRPRFRRIRGAISTC